MKFRPDIMVIKPRVSIRKIETIMEEPMLYSASLEFARKNGGKLTNRVLDDIDSYLTKDISYHANKGYHPVIDTKVTMLKKGWYPSIPGYHCDNVPRGSRFNQPDMSELYNKVFHYVSSISSDNELCPTKFVDEIVDVDIIKSQVWKSVDKALNEDKELLTLDLKSGQIARFSRETLHTCSPAHKDGWRFFFRLSFMATPAKNEIRNQVQIYTDINQGW